VPQNPELNLRKKEPLMKKKALVAGALGVIGRSLIQELERQGDWEVVGISRRIPDFETSSIYLSLDLLDREACENQLRGLKDITHLFYCAFQPRSSWAEHTAPNLAMLVHCVETMNTASAELQHVQLIEGNKWYGSHLGPFRTPAREDDPPHMAPNFYVEQEHWLRNFHAQAQDADAGWNWSALRPHTVCGFSLNSPMNLTTCLAVYALISKELGLPLRFPGKPGAWESIYQVCDSRHLAKAMIWCATGENAANEVFNITNGDYFRWKNIWGRIAEFFEMEPGEVQTIPLTEFMADKEPLWEKLCEKHGLQKIPYSEIAAWPFADYVFGSEWDVMTDTLKLRLHGFHECLRSDEMFVRIFQEFREQKVIP